MTTLTPQPGLFTDLTLKRAAQLKTWARVVRDTYRVLGIFGSLAAAITTALVVFDSSQANMLLAVSGWVVVFSLLGRAYMLTKATEHLDQLAQSAPGDPRDHLNNALGRLRLYLMMDIALSGYMLTAYSLLA